MASPRGLPLGRRAGVKNIPGAGVGGEPGTRRGPEASAESLSLGTALSPATSSMKAPGGHASALPQAIFLPSTSSRPRPRIQHSGTELTTPAGHTRDTQSRVPRRGR